MTTRFKSLALSALVALGTLAAIPATAQADGLYLNFGGRDGVGIRFDDGRTYRDHGRWDRRDRWEDRRDRWERRHEARARCSESRALRKADRMGINRARVVDVDRRTITVRGRAHGDRVRVVFGRYSPSCPIVR